VRAPANPLAANSFCAAAMIRSRVRLKSRCCAIQLPIGPKLCLAGPTDSRRVGGPKRSSILRAPAKALILMWMLNLIKRSLTQVKGVPKELSADKWWKCRRLGWARRVAKAKCVPKCERSFGRRRWDLVSRKSQYCGVQPCDKTRRDIYQARSPAHQATPRSLEP
jgi:hypothetical protein